MTAQCQAKRCVGLASQVMEKALMDAQHGAARLESEAAGPVHLHAQPRPKQALRSARMSYPTLLSRMQLDMAANRMTTFGGSEAESDREEPESSGSEGLSSEAVPGEGPTPRAGCRICRSVEHPMRRCPVAWLAGYSGADSEHGQTPAQHQRTTEGCAWLTHVPDSVKDMMDTMQQFATDSVGASGVSKRLVREL